VSAFKGKARADVAHPPQCYMHSKKSAISLSWWFALPNLGSSWLVFLQQNHI
jgi:hypothetical protein